MRGHVLAAKALLEQTGRQVYVGEVEGAPEFPYYLLWTSTGRERTESLQADDDFIDDTLYVTTSGITAESVMIAAVDARGRLRRAVLSVAGHQVEPLRLEPDQQPITVDRDVVIPGTKRHPQFGVDGYRLVSQPTT